MFLAKRREIRREHVVCYALVGGRHVVAIREPSDDFDLSLLGKNNRAKGSHNGRDHHPGHQLRIEIIRFSSLSKPF